MKARSGDMKSADGSLAIERRRPDSVDLDGRDGQQQGSEDGLIMYLEPDQFVAETSRPVRRAPLSARATAGLWALRVFVVLVSLMVIYTFIMQLR
jgi:hypothetical protein